MQNDLNKIEDILTYFTIDEKEKVLEVPLWYPTCDDAKFNTIQLALYSVRAADDIRIKYDFDRDGWSILQASTFEWDINDKEWDMDWQEVAFVQAWAREKKEEVGDEEEEKSVL